MQLESVNRLLPEGAAPLNAGHAARARTLPARPYTVFMLLKAQAPWLALSRDEREALYDSALVNSADGSGKNIYTRDRRKFRAMLLDSLRLHRRLQREWPRLAERYRAAGVELTSPEAWSRTFEEAS